jgi:hypothetical protein
VAKVVTARRNEVRCRVCQSGRREVFDAALADYLNGVPCRVTGEALTWPKLAERASVLAGEEISVRAARRHLDGHCLVSGEAEVAELDAQAAKDGELLDGVLAELDALLADGGMIQPSSLLALQEKLYLVRLRKDLASGQLPALTHDQGSRAAEKLMASAKKAEEMTLLSALTGGLTSIFQRELGAAGAAELPPAVVDAEFIAED